MYVWEHADPARRQTDGWLGRLLASQLDSLGHPLTACALAEGSTPPEMQGDKATVTVIESTAAYQVHGGAARRNAAPALYRRTPGINGALLDRAPRHARAGRRVLQTS